MGWQDDDGRHEGRAAAEWADGRLSAGSCADGALINGPDLHGAEGVADGREAIGWRGVCECGWRGPLWRRVVGPAGAGPAARQVHDSEPSRWGDPPPGVEDAIWAEWNRDVEVGARLDGRYRQMMHLAYGQADTIFAADEIIAESVRETFAGAITRMLVVPQAVNLELAGTFTQVPGSGHRLLAVQSSFNLKKGLPLLIEVLGLLSHKYPDMTLTVVGHDDTPDAANERKLRALATDLDVLDRIRFVGHLTHVETLEQLASHDVFVDPRVIDSFSSCVYEAMAIGIPVVAADTGCNRTALGDDEDSLFPLGDVASLAERVDRLLGDPRQARARGSVGRRRADKMRSYVGVDAVTDRLAEAYASGRCRQ
ncbi:MAG TPA: glycosyltransferase family 4 protein [Streptosporangiaceae bacterium]|nr:glycosyltransferase family 4 protein [Streptosporangiaceae bacterium]